MPTVAKLARPCPVCRHKERKVLDAVLLAGRSPREVARVYDLSRAQLSRHKKICLEGGQ